ncbi:MAG: phytoene desaturase family protein [Mycobacteriaceae bacterium]
MKNFDAIVIGAGLAGLTTAACLAAEGKKVLVLEQYSVIGGSTHVFRRKGQWEWQVGVHHLADCGPNGAMPTILRGLGLADRIDFLPMDPEGYERYLLPDLEFSLPVGWEKFEARLIDSFPSESKKIRRLIAVCKKMGAAVDRGPSSASFAGMTSAALHSGYTAPLMALSTTTALKTFGLSPQLQTLLGVSPCGSLNVPPSRLPFAAFASFWHLFMTGGAWFPSGGGQVLSTNLADVIAHFGGEILTNAAVEKIIIEHRTAAGVVIEGGQTFRAPIIISTADIKKTYNSLIDSEHIRSSTIKRVNKYRMSSAFFNAFLGVKMDLAATRNNQDHFVIPTWETLDSLEKLAAYNPATDTSEKWLERVTPHLPAYVHCSDMKDPENTRYSPSGSSSLEVMLPIPTDYPLWQAHEESWRTGEYRTNPVYQNVKEALTDIMIARADTAFPGLANKVVHREAATPLTQERFTQSTLGSAYGIEMSLSQFGAFRPGPSTEINGLYLAGASCKPGPTTEGVLLSGAYTASAILGRNLFQQFSQGRYLVGSGRFLKNPSSQDPLETAKKLSSHA